MTESALHLFDGIGIELEYMIVDRETLDVRPLADVVLARAAGAPAHEVELGDVAWSNELVLHVLEMKTNGPTKSPDGWGGRFLSHVQQANLILSEDRCMLLPSGMHPWMDPTRDAKLWPHEQNEIYRAFDRIFGTSGHGWVNLQSTHINLPFDGDAEFARLHAAIRVLLPLLPALTASSPFVAGKRTGILDNRLEFYRHNQQHLPSITGGVIPEPVASRQAYHDRILGTIYREIAPFDPEGILQHEWLNSRGAIARFERGAIEIRLLDIQECPRADMAVIAAISAATQALAEERSVSIDALQLISSDTLRAHFLDAVRLGSHALITDADLQKALGLPGKTPVSMGEAWNTLIGERVDKARAALEGWDEVYTCIHTEGNLAERLLSAVGDVDDIDTVKRVYHRLAETLAKGEVFHVI